MDPSIKYDHTKSSLNYLCDLALQGGSVDWSSWYDRKPLAITDFPEFLVKFTGNSFHDLEFNRLERDQFLNPNNIEVCVVASSLNYRDKFLVLNNMGLQIGKLGFDLAGIVTRVGVDITRLKISDQVYGYSLTAGTLASHVTIPEFQLAHIPKHLNFESASTIPYSYLIASQALLNVSAGDSVLMNLGWSGWIGIAIARIAQNIGAKIFGICGTSERRQYFENIGAQNIYDMRKGEEMSFVDQILEDTKHQGLTIVINNFDEKHSKLESLKLCAKGGKFVDISHSDYLSAKEVTLVRPDVVYCKIDIKSEDPEKLAEIWKTISTGFESGELIPFPMKVFPVPAVGNVLNWFHKQKLGLAKPVIIMPRQSNRV